MGRWKGNAHCHSEDLGWAEITHPFHPLRGQRFRILKTRCVGSVQTLILAGSSSGTFAVSTEWTDHAPPSSFSDSHILEYASLLALRAHIDSLTKKDLTISENRLKSDHVYKWSDKKKNEHSPAETKSHTSRTASLKGDLTGLPGGAIQTLRQTRMQMRKGTRSRPQVLLDCKLPQEAARDGVCARSVPRESQTVPGELPEDERNLGRALVHQPGTSAPQGTALDARHHERVPSHQGASCDLRQHAGRRDGGAA